MEPYEIAIWLIVVGFLGLLYGYFFGRDAGKDYNQFLLRRIRELEEDNERLRSTQDEAFDDWQEV